MKSKYYQLLWLCICILSIQACNVTQPYTNQNKIPQSLYRDSLNSNTINMATISWKEIFRDTLLQNLISEGIQNNLNLKVATTNIKAAEANYVQSNMAFFPSLSANTQGGIYHPSNAQGSNTQLYELYAQSSWQVDLWGKLKSTKKSLLATLLQSEANKQAVQTQLIADIASAYYALMAYDAELTIAEQSIAKYSEDIKTVKLLKESDVVTGASVVQSEANYYAVKSTIPDIKNSIRRTENSLSILLARAPGNIIRDSLSHQAVCDNMQTGVPAQLLANRPDVRAAELELQSYFEMVNVARTYFYPALTITGEAGLYSTNLSNFFKPGAFFANLIGGLTQPIFNNGLNKQRLKVAQANLEAAQYNFQQTLLTAGSEVSNALYSYQMANEKAVSRVQQIANLRKAVFFTSELLKYTDNTTYTDVLTSEQNLLTARNSAVNDQLQKLQAVVGLYAALGGGWK